MGMRDRGEDYLHDIGDMNPAEDLTRLEDIAGPTFPHGIDRRGTGTVNAGEAKEMRGGIELQPVLLGGEAPVATFAARRQVAVLIDPAALAVAIDAGGREITAPGEMPL